MQDILIVASLLAAAMASNSSAVAMLRRYNLSVVGAGVGIPRAPRASTVHVCAAALGNPSVVGELDMMLRSLRSTTTEALSVHVLASDETEVAVRSLLETSSNGAWASASVHIVTPSTISRLVGRVLTDRFPHQTHHSGIWGLAKTFAYALMLEVERSLR